jgi:thiamine-monophosphate kinase
MARPSEDDLIARYFAPLAGPAGLGLRDDAALLAAAPGHEVVVTVDALVERVHFLPEDAAASVARKALGVNVSDLAAKGADPLGFVLALALPPGWTEAWLADFAQGLERAAAEWSCPLIGGDTVKTSGPLSISVTALGQVPEGRMVRRNAARVGDIACVTGTIGDGALGLVLRSAPAWAVGLSSQQREHLADRYLHPRPRVALASILREHATAAMDISDGLAGDLAKMARASGLSAVIDVAQIPLSEGATAALAAESDLIDRILTGGDDYEILCSVPEDRLESFHREAHKAGVSLTAIGRFVDGEDLPAFRHVGGEKRYPAGSFSHF